MPLASATGGASAGTLRRAVPRGRQRGVRILVRSAWFVTLLATLAAIAALLFFYRGDAEGAARTANLEIELQLEAGERVERRVPVMQRHWWDFFRLTHGVLAATDRRLMYVGVPPEDVLPHVPEPTEFIAITYPYNRPLLTRQHRVFVGTRPGLELVGPSDRTSFGYMPRDRERVDSVLAILDRKQAVLRAAAQAERRATDAALAAARQPIYHLVQRGEALGLIARRYGVSTDSLMAWNNLSSPRITAGRRLLVKPGT